MPKAWKTAIDAGQLLNSYLLLERCQIWRNFKLLWTCKVNYTKLHYHMLTDEQMISSPSCFSMQIWKIECERELFAFAWVEPVALFCIIVKIPWGRPSETVWPIASLKLRLLLSRELKFLHFLIIWYRDRRWYNCKDRISFRCIFGRRRHRSVRWALLMQCSWSFPMIEIILPVPYSIKN